MADKRRDQADQDLPRPERAEIEELRDWEVVQKNGADQTQRLKIVGGWLYRTVASSGQVAMVFVEGDE